MATTLPWYRTLGGRLGGLTFLLGAVALLLVVSSLTTLASVQADSAWATESATGRVASREMLYLGRLLSNEAGDRARLEKQMHAVYQDALARLDRLRDGDEGLGIPAPTDPRVRDNLRERRSLWQDKIAPAIDRLGKSDNARAARKDLDEFTHVLERLATLADAGTRLGQEVSARRVAWFQVLMLVLAGVLLAVLALLLWIARGVVRRTRDLAATARRIAGGELGLTAPVEGGDDLAGLAEAFNTMTGNLRANLEGEKKRRARTEKLLDSIRGAVQQLSSASTEILAGTTQQAAGAQEQAAAVSQTVATVNQVTQTADQSAQRAKAVGESVQRTLEVGKAGRRTVEDSLAAMAAVKGQVEATAESIVTLAEQAQAIGEIIATVNDIAEQTNLLALNAAIEASRAGEHGKGFAVVAGEVRALADQSKKATTQVRQILGEIQKATTQAVLATEKVTREAESAMRVGGQAGETIKALTDTLAETARAVTQIAASVAQQATGMTQIHTAMQNIDQVARQNTAAARQASQAAESLNALGTQLAGLTAE